MEQSQKSSGKRIACDWDGTAEFAAVKDVIKKLIAAGHYVEIVTTRYRNPAEYVWYREGIDDNIHKNLFKFAKKVGITIHFTNMVYKADYLNENNFDYLIDDNDEEAKGLINCKFVNVNNIFELSKILLKK